jgi:RecB family exonuclease
MITLKGYIDRVDRNENGRYRVIDYKTGTGHQAKQDLLKGRRLQLPLYAMAVEEAHRLGQVDDGFYWSISAGQMGGLVLSKFESESGSGVRGAMKVAQQHVADILIDVTAMRFSPEPLDGECSQYCPAKYWCWRYSPGR